MLTVQPRETAEAIISSLRITPESTTILRRILPPALVVFLALGISFWRLGQAPLYDTETLYAETGREMFETKDWLNPRFNYDRFLDKPPLYYWALLPVYRLLGTTEKAARVPTALALTGCVALTVLAGILLFDFTTAWLAGLFLATTMGFYIYSHTILVEPLLTLWITATLVSFWGYRQNQSQKAWLWSMYVCLALGFLTKGLTALVFPLVTIGAFLFLTGDRRDFQPLVFWKGWLVFLGLGLPWHLWTAYHHPGYLWFHFINEQIFRFLALRTIKDSPLPTYIFAGLMIPLLFPWSFFLPQSLIFYIRQWREKKLPKPALFVLLWAAVVIGFFSLSKFKLDYYSLPAWPALMLVIAHSLSSRMEGQNSGAAFSIPVGLILLFTGAGWLLSPMAVKLFHLRLPDPWFLRATQRTFGWLFLGSLAASFCLSLREFRAALLCLAASMLPVLAMAQQGMTILGPTLSNKDLAQAANRCLENLPSTAVLAHAGTDEDIYVGSAVFYTGHKVWLVMPREKQVFPLGRTFYLTPEELSSWWGKAEPMLLFGEAEKVSKLLPNLPAYYLSKSGDRVLAANQPVCGARKSSPILVQYRLDLIEGT